jgi:hypothetical protein
MTENDRLGPPPIEPLSELAWSRVERGLWSRLQAAPPVERAAHPQRWFWITAPALAAAAAAIAIALGAGGGRWTDEEPMRMVSGASPTSLSYGDVHLTLDPHSAVLMDHVKGAVIERGGAWFAVAPRGERPAFAVAAGDAMVRVIGTRFRVARSGEEAAVLVEHGTVEVVFRGATMRVRAGEQWLSQQPGVVTAGRLADAEPARAPALEVGPAPGTAPAPGTLPAPEVAGSPEIIDPEPARPAARSHAPGPEAVAPAPAPVPASAPGPSGIDDQATFRRMEALETRDPNAAIEGYLALSRGSSRWAERALYAAARLAADRREPRARILLGFYLQRFPGGANAADARRLLGSPADAHP